METSIVGYLVGRRSRDVVIGSHQRTTREWWKERRKDFEIFISRLVWQEASNGDPEVVRQRLKILKPLRWLAFKKDVLRLAKALIELGPLPARAADDATHIALAAVHGIHFLLTWNCTHINNAEIIGEIRKVCEEQGFACPIVCTPEELIGV